MDAVGYKKLTVWRKADDLAYQTYVATRAFPREEMFGITAQLRRSALSVPTNIVEGYGRQGKKELKHFVNIALGSLAEARYLLDFSARLEYVNAEQYRKLQGLGEEVGRLLWRFYQSILPG